MLGKRSRSLKNTYNLSGFAMALECAAPRECSLQQPSKLISDDPKDVKHLMSRSSCDHPPASPFTQAVIGLNSKCLDGCDQNPHRVSPKSPQPSSGLESCLSDPSNLNISDEILDEQPIFEENGAAYNAVTACFEAMDFMEACFLCKRVLGHGQDIFMYRGDRAFCSEECRHQQIVLDERAERCVKRGSTALKAANGPQSQRRNQRNRPLSAGTAAAA